jgi:hypothetical protein
MSAEVVPGPAPLLMLMITDEEAALDAIGLDGTDDVTA